MISVIQPHVPAQNPASLHSRPETAPQRSPSESLLSHELPIFKDLAGRKPDRFFGFRFRSRPEPGTTNPRSPLSEIRLHTEILGVRV